MVRKAKTDISGMVYNEEEIDLMIEKVKLYQSQKKKSLRDLAEDIGYARTGSTIINDFLKKNRDGKHGLSEKTMLSILKNFQLFFAQFEEAGNVVEPDHPLQFRVNMLQHENEKLLKQIKALRYLLDHKKEKIEKLEKEVEESPDRREFAPSTSGSVYETPVRPVKPEIVS
uniref:Uncharacterized protein n=1 Tax=Panagrolaimus sp. ES5 TaxID=591445 RepID=A0AC34G214_9BILA